LLVDSVESMMMHGLANPKIKVECRGKGGVILFYYVLRSHFTAWC